jgi:hypothetical protein
MHTTIYAHPDREDLERAFVHNYHGASSDLTIGQLVLIVQEDNIALLAATLHRLADELEANQPETVFSEAVSP